jgi:hypothetical protein
VTRLRNNSEGAANGTTATPANTGGDSGNAATDLPGSVAPVFINAQAAGGSQSYSFQAASGSTCIWQWTSDLNAQPGTTLGARFSIFLSALPSQTTEIVQLRTGTGVSARAFITNAGKIQLNDAGNALVKLFSNALALNTWYDVVVKARAGSSSTTGGLYIAYFAHSTPTTPAETPYSNGAGNAGTAALNMVRFGKLTATTWATPFYIDTLTADDEAPFSGNPYVNAGPSVTVAAGTQIGLQGRGTSADLILPTFAWSKDSGPSGSVDTASSPTSTFTPPTPGTYVLRLTATDSSGNSGADTVTVTATGSVSAPRAVASSSQNPVVRANASTPGSGGNLSYAISPTTGVTSIAPGVWQVPDPTVNTVYTVTVTEAGSGLTDTATTTVTPSGRASIGTKVKQSGAWV